MYDESLGYLKVWGTDDRQVTSWIGKDKVTDPIVIRAPIKRVVSWNSVRGAFPSHLPDADRIGNNLYDRQYNGVLVRHPECTYRRYHMDVTERPGFTITEAVAGVGPLNKELSRATFKHATPGTGLEEIHSGPRDAHGNLGFEARSQGKDQIYRVDFHEGCPYATLTFDWQWRGTPSLMMRSEIMAQEDSSSGVAGRFVERIDAELPVKTIQITILGEEPRTIEARDWPDLERACQAMAGEAMRWQLYHNRARLRRWADLPADQETIRLGLVVTE
jgi:hypothetical protein